MYSKRVGIGIRTKYSIMYYMASKKIDINKNETAEYYKSLFTEVIWQRKLLYTLIVCCIILFLVVLMFISQIDLERNSNQYFISSDQTGQTSSSDNNMIKMLIKNKDGTPIATKIDLIIRVYNSSDPKSIILQQKCIGTNGANPNYSGEVVIKLGETCEVENISKKAVLSYENKFITFQIAANNESKQY